MKKVLRVLFCAVMVVAMSLSLTTSAMAQADGHPDVDIVMTITGEPDEYDTLNEGKVKFKIKNNSKKKVVVSKYYTSWDYNGGGEGAHKIDCGKNVTIAPGKSKTITVTVGKDKEVYYFSIDHFYMTFKYGKKYYKYYLYNSTFTDGEWVTYPEDHVYGHDIRTYGDGGTQDLWYETTKENFKTGYCSE